MPRHGLGFQVTAYSRRKAVGRIYSTLYAFGNATSHKDPLACPLHFNRGGVRRPGREDLTSGLFLEGENVPEGHDPSIIARAVRTDITRCRKRYRPLRCVDGDWPKGELVGYNCSGMPCNTKVQHLAGDSCRWRRWEDADAGFHPIQCHRQVVLRLGPRCTTPPASLQKS